MSSKKKGSSYSPQGKSSAKKDSKPFLSLTKDDFEIQTFTAGGPGGQHQNTSNTAVRIIQKASGATGVARDNRSQHQNKRAALVRLVDHATFKVWLNRQLWYKGMLPEQKVAEDMQPKNLKVEVRENNKWVEEHHPSCSRSDRCGGRCMEGQSK